MHVCFVRFDAINCICTVTSRQCDSAIVIAFLAYVDVQKRIVRGAVQKQRWKMQDWKIEQNCIKTAWLKKKISERAIGQIMSLNMPT